MPFYEYECVDCGGRFTRQQHMADPPVADCPACAGRVRKVFHAPGIAVRDGCPMDPGAPACAPGGG